MGGKPSYVQGIDDGVLFLFQAVLGPNFIKGEEKGNVGRVGKIEAGSGDAMMPSMLHSLKTGVVVERRQSQLLQPHFIFRKGLINIGHPSFVRNLPFPLPGVHQPILWVGVAAKNEILIIACQFVQKSQRFSGTMNVHFFNRHFPLRHF